MEFEPFETIEDVPDGMKSLDGIILTLEQANLLAEIKYNLGMEGGSEDIDSNAEWTFKNMFMLKDGAWVKRPADKLYEGMERIGLKVDGGLSAAQEYCKAEKIEYRDQLLKQDKDGIAWLYLQSVKEGAQTFGKQVAKGVTAIYAKAEDVEPELRTEDILGVEIFAAGVWKDSNGTEREVTVKDLNDMAASQGVINPPIKLDHDDDTSETVLHASGLIAAGWMRNFRVVGEKLLCDFMKMPKVVADLVNVGAFRSRSIDLAVNYEDPATKTVWNRVVTGIALLGSKLPALPTLQDVSALYNGLTLSPEVFTYKFEKNEIQKSDRGGLSMNEQEIAEMKAENARLRADKEAADSKASNFEQVKADLETLTADKEALETETAGFKAAEADRAKVDEDKARSEFKLRLAKKIEPADHDAYEETWEAKYAKSPADAETYAAKIDGLKDNGDLETKGADGDPENGQPGAETGADEKIAKFARNNGLDLKKPGDYREAYLGSIEYTDPPAPPAGTIESLKFARGGVS